MATKYTYDDKRWFQITPKYMRQLFALCNKRYFHNILPTVPIHMTQNPKYAGYFLWEPRDGQMYVQIRINDTHLYTEWKAVNLLVHEMIHLYTYCYIPTGLEGHSPAFKGYMELLNEQYGLNVSIITDNANWPRSKKDTWFNRFKCKILNV